MIRVYVLLLLAFVAGIAAMLGFSRDAGYVLVHFGPYIIETSVAGLLTALLGGGLLIWLVLRVLFGLLGLPATLRRVFARRRSERAQRSFELGLLRCYEEDWARAEVDLARRAADRDASHLNYIAAAEAAQQLGAYERRDEYLRLAADGRVHADLAALLSKARLLRASGDLAGAQAALESLRGKDAAQAVVAARLAEVYAEREDWQALQALLDATVELPLPDRAARAALRLRALRGRIAEARAAARLDQLKAVWEAAAELRASAELRLDYIRALARLNAEAEAAAQIGAALQQEYDGELVRLYSRLQSRLQGSDAITRLATVEQWLSRYGERPELLLAAGCASLDARQWGKAQGYLEAARRGAAEPAVYQALARLAEQTQHPDEALRWYREGLALVDG